MIRKQVDTFEELPKWEADQFDLVIADPLYNLNQDQKEFLHSELLRVVKPDGTILVFAPPENQWIQPADQYLFWTKPISTKNTSKRYSRFVEMIFMYGVGFSDTKYHWSNYVNIFPDLVDDISVHQWRKPPSLIRRLILNHTNEGDLVLDPFAGSFIVEQECIANNRTCVSFELNPIE